MRYLSICSGIEAASVAWHGLGWTPVAFSEIEPFPSAVLAHHYPSVPNLGDMTTLPERILSRELEAPDLLVGGPPCQAFSVAGLRRGLDDARGSLTLTYCEIANAIDHVRLADGRDPAIIVYENVPGLLSSKDNAFGCLLAGLAGESEALQAPRGKWRDAGVVVGPQRLAVWRVLDAQFFAVAQRRRRIFLISVALRHPRAWAIAESIFPLSACLSWNPPSRGEARKIPASGVGGGPDGGSISGAVTRKWAKGSGGPAGDECYNMVAQPVAFTRCDNGQDAATDVTPTMRCGSNYSAHLAVAQPVAGSHWDHPSNPHPTLNQSAKGSGGIAASDQELFSQRGSGLVAQPVAFKVRGGVEVDSAGKAAGKGYLGSEETAFTLAATQDQWLAAPVPVRDVAQTLTSNYGKQPDNSDTALGPNVVMQAVGTDCYNGAITGDVAATIGTPGSSVNASGPTVMQAMAFPIDTQNMTEGHASGGLGFGQESDPSFTLTKGHSHAVAEVKQVQWASGGGQVENDTAQALRAGAEYNYQFARIAMQVRRLTPTECERLQGFPDGYTNIPWRKKPECPDGPRYKALGNSMAVPCMRWIGERIQAATARQESP